MSICMLKKIVKFCIVSVTGVLVDLGITAFLLKFFRLDELLHHSLGSLVMGNVDSQVSVVIFVNVFAFILAITTTYYLNRIWTWKSHNPAVTNEYARFFAVAISGLIINLMLIYLIGTNYNLDMIVSGYLVPSLLAVKTIAAVFVTAWNFAINNIFTFRIPTKFELENAEDYCDYTDYDKDDDIDNDDDYIPKT